MTDFTLTAHPDATVYELWDKAVEAARVYLEELYITDENASEARVEARTWVYALTLFVEEDEAQVFRAVTDAAIKTAEAKK